MKLKKKQILNSQNDSILNVLLICICVAAFLNAKAEDIFFSSTSIGTQEATVGRGAITLLGDQYLTEGSSSGHEYFYSTLGLEYQKNSYSKKNTTLMHGWAQSGLSSSTESHFTVPEFYYGYKISNGESELGIGRKEIKWSLIDQSWHLGIWQPLFKWDLLRTQQQGLMGIFWKIDRINKSDLNIELFFSMINLPDQGPQFSLTDGDFKTSNRWFNLPQEQIQDIHGQSNIYYRLQKPKVEDVVLNRSLGLRILKGDLDEGFWVQGSWAEKPMNQLHFGFEGYSSLALADDSGKAYADIYAEVVDHRVLSVELGHSSQKAKVWVSYNQERVGTSSFDKDWAQTPLLDHNIYGINFSHELSSFIPGRNLFTWSYLNINESTPKRDQKDSEAVSLVNAEVESSLMRFPLKEAVSLQWKSSIWNEPNKRLGLQSQFVYSFSDKASWTNLQVHWGISPNVNWHLSLDVLGVKSEGNEEEEKSIFSQYRQNDRIVAGVSYVF